MADQDWTVVYRTTDRYEASIVVAKLKAAGYEALVRGDDAAGLYSSLSLTEGIDILVWADHGPACKDLLKS